MASLKVCHALLAMPCTVECNWFLSRLNKESTHFHTPITPLCPLFVSIAIANKLISRKINVSMRVEATFCLAAY